MIDEETLAQMNGKCLDFVVIGGVWHGASGHPGEDEVLTSL